ncbi:MAG TPA: ParB/RepB/Spo0J family partition protein [Actinomycetota bacterium]
MSDESVSQRRPGGLGRGLSALLPTTPAPSQPEPAAASGTAHGPSLREIPIDEIAPNPRQPRDVFDHERLEELAASIRVAGILQPVVVRRLGAGYQLVMGERRVRAARLAGLRMIPALVRDTTDDAMLRDALIENVQRQDLNPIEEAVAIKALVDEHGISHHEVAERLGRSRPAVTNALRLLTLAESVQDRIASGSLSAAHGRTIAAIADHSAQERLARRISAEGLSVRATEEAVRRLAAQPSAPAATAPKQTPPRSAGILEVEHRLADMLDTRVRVEAARRGRGRIIVEFADEIDLDRIFRSIARD